MRLPFAFRLALRESRSSMRRLGLYMGAITLGVAALVAINAYRANIVDAVRADAQRLLGGDLRLQSDQPLPDSVELLIDSLVTSGATVVRVTGTLSMGMIRPRDAPEAGRARLVQLRAVEAGYPLYDEWHTRPGGQWPLVSGRRDAIVEPALLLQTGARIGDTIQLGNMRFRIAAAFVDLPAEFGFRGAAGPRVFIAHEHIDDTGLITRGSLSEQQAFVRLGEPTSAPRFIDRYRERLRGMHVSVESAEGQGEDVAEAVGALSRFLGLVGLTALLLGGLGVGSAVNVFVKDKRTTIATLRCIGATQRQAFTAYLIQAGMLGLAGAVAGVLLGLLVQAALPYVLRDTLPITVAFEVRALPVLSGLAIGVLVALLFALLPLLEIRGITPLQAIRHEIEPVRHRLDPVRGFAYVTLAAGVVGIAMWQAGEWAIGLAYAAAIIITVLLLLGCAVLLTYATRRWFPRRSRFVFRQGIASLFRPQNQTAAITVALGFGVFLVATMLLVQHNLVDRFELDTEGEQPNILAFGIQREQRAGIGALVEQAGSSPRIEPIVTARIAAINGIDVDTILASAQTRDIEPWALRREYRNTYRDSLTSAETLVAGEWFDAAVPDNTGAPARISIEDDLAEAMGVALGDTLTWDVQGRMLSSVITSIRDVDWGRLDTNFFVVFEPGALEGVPQSFVLLASIPADSARAALQRELATLYPAVSAIDLAQVQQTLEQIIGRATLGIRFMGAFSVVAGILVLAGAIAATRLQRLRESVLLRTLGARRAQIRTILFTEYAALGSLAAATGGVLAIAASWALVRFVFDFPFSVPMLQLIATVGATVLIAVLVGAAGSRRVLRSTPLEVLRAADAR